MNHPKIVYLEWLDINTDAGPWIKFDADNDPSLCTTVGFLVSENEKRVVVTATYSDHDDGEREAMQTAAIPRACILRMETCDAAPFLALWSK